MEDRADAVLKGAGRVMQEIVTEACLLDKGAVKIGIELCQPTLFKVEYLTDLVLFVLDCIGYQGLFPYEGE